MAIVLYPRDATKRALALSHVDAPKGEMCGEQRGKTTAATHEVIFRISSLGEERSIVQLPASLKTRAMTRSDGSKTIVAGLKQERSCSARPPASSVGSPPPIDGE